MARKNSKQSAKESANPLRTLPDETKRAIIAVFLVVVGIIFTLAYFGAAGNGGSDVYRLFNYLLGVGYFLVPVLFFILAWSALREESTGFNPFKLLASAIFIFAGLGFVDIVSGRGGLVGDAIAHPAVNFFDIYAALILLGGLSLISLLILLEGKISTAPFIFLGQSFAALGRKIMALIFKPKEVGDLSIEELPEGDEEDGLAPTYARVDEEEDEPARTPTPARAAIATGPSAKDLQAKSAAANLKSLLGEYTPPPLSLLERDKGRPGVGDIKANANIIKRTLANFGIVVELDEISIGPSVTRYAIKPAEGVRLQKILSLQTNLELALAAHPVRIEAPIPGKSLVGIEVPNSAKVTVGLGTLLEAKEFADSPKPLLVALGRDIVGNSHFGNIAKMPHMLIAGATGSGKSVTIHAIITSLLYRAGPQQLRFLMIDPKRVELTLYNKIPHLLSPVITDPKKAIMALRWAGREMERRYNILEEHRVRDIDSYHQNVLTPALERIRKEGEPEEGEPVPEAMPYIVVVIDELADIMQTFPRELEAAIVRLAQMSRAVGIHLLLSTQRPSVNVITGLIKANVPSRLALQVASQIDSRTILDQGGAEKLLGAGDMLYLGGDMGKPVRLQSAFIGEGEVKKVTDFIAKNNDVEIPIDIAAPAPGVTSISLNDSGGTGGGLDEEVDDDMYEAAHAAVLEAGKASTSYIQRKLRVGYARAARLVDMLEERGVIGPGDGAKPREVLGRAPVAGGEPHDMSEEV
ncbi:MAG: DNA translocase FtsK [Candidatus Adlerbacteria bacterium]|nr:DNA translocase FtsK [Candidatus Adlerbacteria bacterium]